MSDVGLTREEALARIREAEAARPKPMRSGCLVTVLPDVVVCPRCGGSIEGERFYGPCSSCVVELCQLKPPAPDPNFVPAMLPNGLPTTAYVGPRVDRETTA